MSLKKITIILSLVIGVNIFAACSSQEDVDTNEKRPREAIELTSATRAAAEDLTDFYVNFTTDMAHYAATSKESNGNVIVSPLSAAMVFALTANGVEPADRVIFTDYLGTTDIKSLNSLSSILLDRLPKADNTATMNLANSIWVNSGLGVSLSKEFTSIASSIYNASISHQDFVNHPDQTMEAMNEWCRKTTSGQIVSHFEDINPNSLAILLNSLYFKADWMFELFDSHNTKKDVFHGAAGDTEVDMMESCYFSSNFADDGQFEYYTVGLGNNAFCLKLIVPDEKINIDEACGLLTPVRMTSLNEASKNVLLKLFMPKFRYSNRCDINGMLEATGKEGMCEKIAFSMFEPITNGGMKYLQSASLSLDERGAIVAAVTSGETKLTNYVSEFPDEVIARIDTPFFFFIEEFSTGACILSGYISNIE